MTSKYLAQHPISNSAALPTKVDLTTLAPGKVRNGVRNGALASCSFALVEKSFADFPPRLTTSNNIVAAKPPPSQSQPVSVISSPSGMPIIDSGAVKVPIYDCIPNLANRNAAKELTGDRVPKPANRAAMTQNDLGYDRISKPVSSTATKELGHNHTSKPDSRVATKELGHDCTSKPDSRAATKEQGHNCTSKLANQAATKAPACDQTSKPTKSS